MQREDLLRPRGAPRRAWIAQHGDFALRTALPAPLPPRGGSRPIPQCRDPLGSRGAGQPRSMEFRGDERSTHGQSPDRRRHEAFVIVSGRWHTPASCGRAAGRGRAGIRVSNGYVLHGPRYRGTAKPTRRGRSHLRLARRSHAGVRQPAPRFRGSGRTARHLARSPGRRRRLGAASRPRRTGIHRYRKISRPMIKLSGTTPKCRLSSLSRGLSPSTHHPIPSR